MNWVDYLLLVLVVLSAVHGLRLGAAMQVLSFGGLWLGLFLGALMTPRLAGLVHTTTTKTLIAAVVVLGMAGALGGVGRLVGAHSSTALQRLRLGPIDSAAGVAVAVFATLVATWLVASILVNSRFTSLDTALHDSRIVRTMNNVLPPVPAVFSRIESFLAAEGFPVVFAGLPPQSATPVTRPSNAAVAAAVVAAGPSTVQVAGAGCGVIQEGSGFVVAPGLVVTNAHVIAGIPRPFVIDSAGRYNATAVLFDPELDIAVLRVPGLGDKSLSLVSGSSPVRPGSTAAVLGYPEGGPFTFTPAGVAAAFRATGLDIYGTATTQRTIYELDAQVRPGNSGGPLVASGDAAEGIPDGTVIGVVFARSTTNSGIGYALTMPAVERDIAAARSATATVGTGACTAG
ncbi:MAG: MarP family serine protease [Acidimicrobiales bacterium]|jgi:S1-C subfamily serine protease